MHNMISSYPTFLDDWKRRSATYELDDFKAIAVVQFGLGPLITGNNLAVQFNRDTVCFHTKMLNKRAETSCGCRLSFAVDDEVHLLIFAAVAESGQARRGHPRVGKASPYLV